MCFLVPQSGATPLWYACYGGNTATAALLIDHGANVNRPRAVSHLEVHVLYQNANNVHIILKNFNDMRIFSLPAI